MKKKLLIIYYNFPPVKVPGAVRLKNIYEQSLNHFLQTFVVTTSNRHFFLQDESLQTSALCYEVPAYDLRRLVQLFRSEKSVQISQKSKKTLYYKIFAKFKDSFPFNLLLDDGNISYIYFAYQKAKKIVAEENITHIFSTFRPYADHIVAYLLKKRFPDLIWIADFRDLHVDPANKNVMWPKWQKRVNRFFLRRASILTTVSEGLQQHLQMIHPRTFVLYNGLKTLHNKLSESPLHLKDDKFTILYTGSLFKDKRRPHLLFQAIKAILQEHPYPIVIAYAGRDEAAWKELILKYQLEAIAQYYGLVRLSKAQQLQSQAQINLLLTYTHKELYGNITSKTFEYLAAGKPILAIINGPEDKELEDIFRSTNAGMIAYDNPIYPEEFHKIKEFLLKYCRYWYTHHSLKTEINHTALVKYSWPFQFKAFMNKLSDEEV